MRAFCQHENSNPERRGILMKWNFFREFGGYRAYRHRLFIMSLILLIPVLMISFVNYAIIHLQNNAAIESNLRFNSQRHLEMMASQMDIIQKLINQHRKDDSFYTWDQTSFPATFFDVREALSRDSLWASLFSDIGYYNVKDGYVISLRGMENENYYFSKVALPGKNKKALLTTRPKSTIPIRVHSSLFNRDGVVFCAPFEINEKDQTVSFLLFTIFDSDLDSLLKNEYGKGSFATLFYHGIPFFSTNEKVKAEIYRGEDISAFINNSKASRIYRYSNTEFSVSWNIGKAAFAASEIGLVTKEALVTFLVLIFGFAFLSHYSRKSYQPLWNILQNLPAQYRKNAVTDEMECLDAALSDLAYSKNFLEETNSELKQEKYLYYILDNQVRKGGALFQQCLNAGIRVDRKYFACILLDDTEENQELYEYLTVGKIPDHIDLCSMYIMGNKYLFLLCADVNRNVLESFLGHLPGIEKGHTAVSEIVEGVQNVRRAYTSVCSREIRLSHLAVPEKYPELELESLKEAVMVENADKVEFSLRMIKNNLYCYSENLRAFVFASICEILLEGNREKISCQMRNVSAADAESVKNAIDQLFSSWLRENQVQQRLVSHGSVMRRCSLSGILQYIQKNYMSPNFSIKCMAAEFGTSPSNLSHYFKKVTGRTLSGFIDEMKIKKAEEFLSQGKKVCRVAKELGYNSTSVFIEAFKRQRGVTPSAFRNRKGSNHFG